MSALWTYPWDLAAEGLDDAIADAARRGIDTLTPAVHYHSVQSMRPRVRDSLFERNPGGCYFEPNPERYVDTPIDPLRNEVAGVTDPLDAITASAAEHEIDVNAWTVLCHNSRLGAANPSYCIQDAFDTTHEHAFCPSHEAVQSYFEGLVADIASYPVAAVELESIGFPSVLHGHDTTFGHAKRQVLTSSTEEWLLSQCFCSGCRARAKGIDMDRAQRRVQSLLEDSLEAPHANPPALDALVREYPVLDDLVALRSNVVSSLLDRLSSAVGDVSLDVYLMDGFGVDPGENWPAGVRLADIERYADRATAICYESDPATVRDRLRAFNRELDLPIDAGVTLNPDVIKRESQFRAVLDAAREASTGSVAIYHHTLATEAQLDWIERAVSE